MSTITAAPPGPISGTDRLLAIWDKFRRPIFYLILIGWAVIAIAPLYFTLVFSLKPVANAYDAPLWWPRPFTLENYRTVLESFEPFPRWVLISVIVSGITTGLQVLFCAMGGYAFARLKFPLQNALFVLLLVSMMIPGQVTLIPNFLVIGPGIARDLEIAGVSIPTGFGLLDKLSGVILPGGGGGFWHLYDDPILQGLSARDRGSGHDRRARPVGHL